MTVNAQSLPFKRGNTFEVQCFHHEPDGTGVDLTSIAITSQVRDGTGLLLADCTITKADQLDPATRGHFSARVQASITAAWPLGVLNADVRYDDGSNTINTDTLLIRCQEPITQPGGAP